MEHRTVSTFGEDVRPSKPEKGVISTASFGRSDRGLLL